MPAPWYIRFLPYLGIVLAVLAGVWYLQHIGYQRAQRDRDAADAKLRIAIQADLRSFEQNAIAREAKRGNELDARLSTIAHSAAQGRDRIIKEMTHEIRFTDPALGIPDSVRAEINRALTASACSAAADGSIRCAVRDGDGAGEQ